MWNSISIGITKMGEFCPINSEHLYCFLDMCYELFTISEIFLRHKLPTTSNTNIMTVHTT
jgi:hypothetical protein